MLNSFYVIIVYGGLRTGIIPAQYFIVKTNHGPFVMTEPVPRTTVTIKRSLIGF